MNNVDLKAQLKEAFEKKELVKPNTTEQRLSQEVESLCDFTCSATVNAARGAGDVTEEGDILF